MPWQRVEWTVSLAALLVYMWSVTTYSVPLGQPAMAVAIVGLAFIPELRFPPFMAIFGAFVIWCAFGYTNSAYQAEVATGLEILWKVWLIAFVVVNATRTRTQQRVFMFVFLGAYALYPVRGAIFNYVGGYTLFGRALWNYIYANPNDLAALTLLMLGLAAGLLVREPKGWPRLAALAGVVLLPFLILMTQSRGAFIALSLFGFVLVARFRRNVRALLGVVAVAVVVAVFAPSGVWERVRGLRNVTDTEHLDTVDQEGSAEQRFEIWKVATSIISEHPVSGVGFGAYSQAHMQAARDSRFKRIAQGPRDSHSTYLNVLAETGFVGGALYAALILTVLLGTERTRRRARAILPNSAQQLLFIELGIIAFFVAGIFGSFSKLSFTYILLALLWSVTKTTGEELDALAQRPMHGVPGIGPLPRGARPSVG